MAINTEVLKGKLQSSNGIKGSKIAVVGPKGDSAYDVAVEEGFVGTKEEWLQSLKGNKGDNGYTPVKGTDYFTEVEIQEIQNNILDAVNQFSVQILEVLPTDDIDTHTIYFIPKQTSKSQDVYDEFIYIDNGWEHIGTTDIDLSNYYTKAEIDTEIDNIEALPTRRNSRTSTNQKK